MQRAKNILQQICTSKLGQRMVTIIHFLRSYVFIRLVKEHVLSLLLPVYHVALKQVMPDGTRVRLCRRKIDGKHVILALSRGLFRGDLEVLAQVPDFCILEIPEFYQNIIVSAFYPQRNMDTPEFFNLAKVQDIEVGRKQCRKFLHKFLSILYRKVPVDCVISCNDRNQADFDWGVISQRLNVPYLILFREGLIMSDHVYQGVIERVKSEGKFEGAHFIAQNQVTKKAYLEAEFLTPSQISVHGILRMDDFLTQINKERNLRKRKLVVFFYFPNKQMFFGNEGNYELYKYANLTIAKLALNLPDVDFVVKPKHKAGLWDEENFRQVFADEGIDIDDIPNFKVEPFADVHKLILHADVVCGGFNSLVVLEAAVAGKPIVLPCFKEYRELKFFDRFFFRNHLHLFDVADDAEDYEQKINNRLNDGHVDSEIQKGRERLFEEYCLPLSGTAKESCSKTIRSVIREYRSLRKEK